MAGEEQRIRFLVERDGRAEAHRWVREMLETYRAAVNTPGSHASTKYYRPGFERSIREFEQWLEQEGDLKNE